MRQSKDLDIAQAMLTERLEARVTNASRLMKDYVHMVHNNNAVKEREFAETKRRCTWGIPNFAKLIEDAQKCTDEMLTVNAKIKDEQNNKTSGGS